MDCLLILGYTLNSDGDCLRSRHDLATSFFVHDGVHERHPTEVVVRIAAKGAYPFLKGNEVHSKLATCWLITWQDYIARYKHASVLLSLRLVEGQRLTVKLN